MMKKNRIMLALAVCIAMAAMFMLVGCGGSSEEATEETTATAEHATAAPPPPTFEEADAPDEVMTVIQAAMTVAEGAAKDLTPDFGDQYVALIQSGEARDYKDYDAMKAQLDKIREDNGAQYVYCLSPGKDGTPSLEGETGPGSHFLITVDGSEDPDDWAVDYEWETQFKEAWDGATASARSAWEEEDSLYWSAFAPIKDSKGNVVCILGVDYPADEIKDFPEWDRDSDKWNGIVE